jgi:catechol 2,3-dioxygenase-like lactoylglutathione lyase family enzyme
MTITHLQLMSIPVTDQDRARHFYVDVLGFTLVRDNHMGPAQRWIQVAPEGAATSITLVNWFESMPAGSIGGLVLESDDLDADIARLTDQGVPVSDVQDEPWGRYVTLKDPDGNGLVLQTTKMLRGDLAGA